VGVRYTKTLHYPANVADVGKMLADPQFVQLAAQRSTPNGTIEVADVAPRDDGGFTVTVRRKLPVASVPPQFRPFVGSEIELRQAEVWEPEADGIRRGTVSQEIVGTPLIVTGTVALEPVGNKTRQTYEGEIQIQLPPIALMMMPGLIDSIAHAAMQPVDDALALTQRTGRDWLAGKRA